MALHSPPHNPQGSPSCQPVCSTPAWLWQWTSQSCLCGPFSTLPWRSPARKHGARPCESVWKSSGKTLNGSGFAFAVLFSLAHETSHEKGGCQALGILSTFGAKAYAAAGLLSDEASSTTLLMPNKLRSTSKGAPDLGGCGGCILAHATQHATRHAIRRKCRKKTQLFF